MGSFAIHAAREHGVSVTGVTLSPAQAELARARVQEADVADRVEIRVADYRDFPPCSFDAIASIGMAEHVGESPDRPLRAVAVRAAAPGGLLLNHAIAVLDPDDDPLEDLFSMRYVFPDGEPLPLSRVQLALERAGFHTEHVEGFREDYADHPPPLGRAASTSTSPRPSALAGSERTRVWRLYLRAARHGFDVGLTAVYQVRARRPA